MRIHIVGRGETLLEIAKKTGLPAARLAAENGLAPTSRLTEGQSLLYTRPARLRAVRHGERTEDLCRAEDLSLRHFLRLNPMPETDDRLLPVGQEFAVAQSAVPFGQMSVFGIMSEKASPEDCVASLPYMTCLVCEGCRFTEDRILAPACVRRLRMRYPALVPALWAAVGADVLPWLLCRGGTEKLPVLLREAGLEGICVVFDAGGMRLCGGHTPSASPCRPRPEGQTDDREAREAVDGSTDGIGRLREVLTDAGMGVCVCAAEIPAAPGEISGSPCLLRGTEGEGLTAACRRIGATENGLRRRMLWPRLPDSAVCFSVWPDGTKQKESADLRQIPALLERCRPTVRREEGGASFSYRTRAGRQAIRHEMYFEDAFSLSEGLYEMNRRGLGGVWCDAARVPLWMLYMLSACYEIVDPRPRRG